MVIPPAGYGAGGAGAAAGAGPAGGGPKDIYKDYPFPSFIS